MEPSNYLKVMKMAEPVSLDVTRDNNHKFQVVRFRVGH